MNSTRVRVADVRLPLAYSHLGVAHLEIERVDPPSCARFLHLVIGGETRRLYIKTKSSKVWFVMSVFRSGQQPDLPSVDAAVADALESVDISD